MDSRSVWGRIWPPAAALLLFIAVWEAACRWVPIDPYVLPSPSAIAERTIADAERIGYHLSATLGLAMSGVGIGFAAGVALAIILHLFPFIRITVSPFVIATQNIPLIVLAPLLMIWFGFGLSPKLILLTLVGFFPVALSTLAGLGQAQPHLREYLAMIGATKWQTLRLLELPASLPYMFSGLKITVTYSVTTAIVAEWLGASRGIGYYLVLKFKGFDISAVFGSVICIIVLCLLLYSAAAALERLVIYWGPQRRSPMTGTGGGPS